MARIPALVAAAAAYVAFAIFTFGHAAAHHPARPWLDQRGALISTNSDLTVIGAGVAGLLWPLYWSWELQR